MRTSNCLESQRSADLGSALARYAAGQEGDELRSRFQFVERFIDGIATPVFYKDTSGRFMGCNVAYERYFGISSSRLRGMTVHDVSPKGADLHHQMDLRLFRAPTSISYEAQVTDRRGRVRDVILYKSAILDADGNVTGVVGIIVDVTAGKMAHRKLLDTNQILEQRVAQRTGELSAANLQLEALNREMSQVLSERERLEADLEKYCVRLRELVSDLNLAEERERRRIARELHDDAVQSLALGHMTLAMGCREGWSRDFPDLLDRIFNEAIQKVRAVCHQLSSPILYELGVGQAVENLTQELARNHNFTYTLHKDLQEDTIPPATSIMIFQTSRELLVNAVKHGRPSTIRIELRQRLGVVKIAVMNDGLPFVGDFSGFGLTNIRQRVWSLKGDIHIRKTPSGNTLVEVTVPLPDVASEPP